MRMYILVNKDLNMSMGKTCAQVAHTVVNFTEEYNCTARDYLQWKANGQTKIVLQAPQSLMEELEKSYWSVRDKGLTEIPPNSLTAICLGIDTKENFYEKIPKLKRLRLL